MSKRSRKEWDLFQLKLARQYSTMSKDPQTQVGAVVCDSDSKHVYGLGYNGLPAHMDDDPQLLSDREYKLRHTIHAEDNALFQAYDNLHPSRDERLTELTMVVYPFLPCSECAKEICHAFSNYNMNFTRVVTLDYVPERWQEDFAKSEEILTKAGIQVVRYPMSSLEVCRRAQY